MLILSRRIGDKIKINDDIFITLVSIDKNQVKLGFDAPKDYKIMRTEIIEKYENKEKSE